jgi:hypothetical protein
MPQAKRAPLTREESQKAVVVRNPKVTYVREGDGGRLEMTVTVMGGSWLARLFGKGTPVERTRGMQLDATGAFCWERCDGESTVEEVGEALAQHDELPPERAEESLWNFLGMLSARGLVALSMRAPEKEGEGDASTDAS